MRAIVINIAAFQLTWFACALGAANGSPWPGVAAAVLAIAISLREAGDIAARLMLVAAAGLIGAFTESALAYFGLVAYAASKPMIAYAPLWIIALWMAFATLFPQSLSALSSRPAVAILLGAIFGPLAYYAGVRLGALELGEPVWRSFVAISVVWGTATPALGMLHTHLEKSRTDT